MHIYLPVPAQQFYKLLYGKSQNLCWNVTYIVYFFQFLSSCCQIRLEEFVLLLNLLAVGQATGRLKNIKMSCLYET